MENLSEKVYECTLAVEAHMVCDLLSQAGISARVDGEFMQSAMGEIPLGNAVKVRVDPARAAEAREVIADWEKLQPVDPIAVPVTKTFALQVTAVVHRRHNGASRGVADRIGRCADHATTVALTTTAMDQRNQLPL